MGDDMKDYLQLILDNNININFNPKTVHVWVENGKLKSQNNAATIKLSQTEGCKVKALHLAVDALLGE